MDRLIEVKVKGNHLTQDNNVAGTQYEGNVTALRIEFDKGWDNYAKTVIFFDAYGQHPVKRVLTADLLEDFANNTRVYRCLIPAEPMQYDGKMSYVIEGYLNGKRQRGIEAKLKVLASPYTDNAGQPTDPTPTQAEQLQVQIEAMIGTVRTERAQAETARVGAETARAGAETAQGKAEQAQSKAEEARDAAADAEAMANSHLEDAKTNAGWAIAAADEATAAMREAQTAKEGAETAQAEAETQARIATQSMTNAQHAEAGAEKAQAAAENAAGNAARDAVMDVEEQLAQHVQASTNAKNAAQASAQAAATSATEAYEHAQSVNPDELRAMINDRGDGLLYDDATHMLYLTSGGEIISDGIQVATGTGGGGGGGESNNAVLTLKNTTGWMYKSVSLGASCPITFTWSSIEEEMPTGNGVLKVTVNGTVKETRQIEQGDNTIDVGELLSAGTCTVKLNVTDTYGNSRSINFNITAVSLELSSTFDASVAYEGTITFPYTPTAAVTKTMHFAIDGTEIGSATVIASGRQQTFTIPAQAHGMHIFECWYTATVDGEDVESDKLRYALICIETGNTKPIIATAWNKAEVEQFETINIPYIVYDPASLTTKVSLSDGGTPTELTVDRTQQMWSYRIDDEGELTLSISCGTTILLLEMTAKATSVNVEAETNDLSLYLTSYGRSNNEDNPSEWKYKDISASLTDFNYISDGWVLDDKGVTVLRVQGDARVTIPAQLFATDFRTSGKTIEIEFATRNVLNYDAVVFSCFSGERGIKITAQKAMLKSEQSEISTQYKEDEKVRLSFVVEKRAEHRLLCIYINGIMSGVVQYPTDDDFSQNNPVGITIGSSECTTDIYGIRVYENNLTRYQILDNWNADMQVLSERAEAYKRNDIFDDYGAIVIDKLPADLPYMVLEGSALPTYKGNKLTVSGRYVDPIDSTKSFTFTGAEIDVQGTSSAGYERKNYKIAFKNGINQNGTQRETYLLGANNIPTDTFTFKADVASSEGANNVELAKLYNDISPYRIPPQETDERVRQGIDGYPCVIFHDAGDGAVFIGKYNFNHDKGTPEVFGFNADDESWEIKNNTSNRVIFKDADFSGTGWKNDFEARHPEDNTDIANLKALAEWIVSTDRDAVTSEADKAARLQKFRDELGNYCDIESTLFYYLFTELFLLADSRAKNAFPTRYDNGKWCWLPYDMDTAIGTNNEGKLAFDYYLEDTDLVGTAQVYTGQKSVLWNNVRDAFPEELMEMYQKLRSDGVLSYADTEKRFADHQAKWSAAIFNEDSYYKYLAPLFEKNNGSYLGMLQGSKAEQRKWWLYNRFRYIDSKYNAGDALTDFITLRGYSKGNIVVTPYADIYATVKYGSYLVQERALRGDSYTLECPVDDLDDTEIYIYSASQIANLGDLSALQVGYAEFAAGTKLTSLKLGDSADTYSNQNLTQLYAGNNALLKVLDVRNCPNLGNTAADVNATPAIDLSGCVNIEEVYFDNTAITSVTLPNGGILKKLHLPATVTNLTLRNQTALTEFVMPSYANVSTLRLENVASVVDGWTILHQMPANSRVRMIGFDWTRNSAADILSLYDYLDTMRGLDENGNNVDKAQMQGVIHIDSLTGSQLAEMQRRYPSITIDYKHITSYVYFYNYDGTKVLYTASSVDGAEVKYSGSTPTKPATAQYNYTHSGWSKTIGGAADANALKNITGDRNVYPAFTSTVRTYTVTWVNDGVTLETDTGVPYGTVPTYNGSTPVDGTNGLAFIGWTPEVKAITGNTTYTATFESPVVVAEITDSWDTILNNVVKNRASLIYNIGNYKPLDLGTEGVINMQIAAFDTDVYADGSGKAPVTWIARELLTTSVAFGSSGQSWANSNIRTYLQGTIDTMIPDNVKTHVATVSKTHRQKNGYEETTEDTLWLPSATEVLGRSNYGQDGGAIKYTQLFGATTRVKMKVGTTTAIPWNTRSALMDITSGYIDSNGQENYSAKVSPQGVCLSFCLGVSEISDSWDTIISNINAGTYKDKYKIGDWKAVDLGEHGTIRMQIAAFDTDELADGSGTAAVTWLARETLATTQTGRSHSVWSTNADRTYLANTILPLFPSNIRSNIKSVNKSHLRQHSNGSSVEGVYETETTQDSLWIPSAAEVGIGLQSSGWSTHYRTSDAYGLFASENGTRKRNKIDTGNGFAYSLRDAAVFWPSDSLCIAGNGDWTSNSGEVSMLIGFCVGKTPDPWDAVFASIEAGTYKTDYAIGDTVPLDLGTEGVVNMQIAAFDADDLADGTGKAAITWISKELLPTKRRMAPQRAGEEGAYTEGTGTIGGWEKSEMRAYLTDTIMPTIATAARNQIVAVSKTQDSYDTTNTKVSQTTTDSLWIPSKPEINGSTSLYYALFKDASSNRIKYGHPNGAASEAGKARPWWLRSALYGTSYDCVNTGGGCTNAGNVHSGYGIGSSSHYSGTFALGFCTGKAK